MSQPAGLSLTRYSAPIECKPVIAGFPLVKRPTPKLLQAHLRKRGVPSLRTLEGLTEFQSFKECMARFPRVFQRP